MLAYVSTMRISKGLLETNSFSAFADADLTTLATCAAIGDGMNSKIFNASATVRPLTRSSRRLTFLTEYPVFVVVAVTATDFTSPMSFVQTSTNHDP